MTTWSTGSRRFPGAPIAALWVATCLLVIYGWDIGKGFVADDFAWIYFSRINDARDVWTPFVAPPPGFYRPLVALSWGFSERLFGLAPMPYAMTNLCMVFAIAAGIVGLSRSLGFSALGGVFAAALWALNFHGIDMALTWISGRTSLMTTLFAVMAAIAFVNTRFMLAGLFTLGALLSKEEPVMLPVVFAIWTWIDLRSTSRPVSISLVARRSIRAAGASFVALAIYVALRSQTDAFTPVDAPSFYQLTFAPAGVFRNALEYLDRSLTFTTAVLLLGWLAFSRQRVRLDEAEWRVILKGSAWLIFGFAVTIFVPVRSSLYVCFPTVGSALIGLGVGRALWRSIPVAKRQAAVASAVVLPLLLLPIHWARHQPSKDNALLSSRFVARLQAAVRATPGITRIIVYDDASARPSMMTAFAGALPQAVELVIGRPVPVEVIPIASPDPHAFVEHEPAVLQFVVKNRDVQQPD